MRLNPHPAGQLALNIPDFDDEPLPGVQHKYPETVLVFPRQGQTCHAYCAYCFRWAQFVDEPELKMATADLGRVMEYLRQHREVTSRADHRRRRPDDHGRNRPAPVHRAAAGTGTGAHRESVRIGSKSLAYWPQRFVSDPDADETLRLFEQVVDSGRSLQRSWRTSRTLGNWNPRWPPRPAAGSGLPEP